MSYLISDLISLIYPDVCTICSNALVQNERVICLTCLYDIPLTNYVSATNNEMIAQLYGVSPIKAALAYCHYSDTGMVKNAIHNLKYNNKHEVGTFLGRLLGQLVAKMPPLNSADILVPVPIHPKKLKLRGYNQSEFIAKGISEVTGIPVNNKLLTREIHSLSQTKKDQWERLGQQKDAYVLHEEEFCPGSILIVDDVMTTGGTLTACSKAFDNKDNVRLFAATVAFTLK